MVFLALLSNFETAMNQGNCFLESHFREGVKSLNCTPGHVVAASLT